MKKFLIIAAAAMFCFPAMADKQFEERVLTEDEIRELLDQAEGDGVFTRHTVIEGLAGGVDPGIVIAPDQFDMFSDTSVLCAQPEKFGAAPSTLPLGDTGEVDASLLPEHCSLMHKLVARKNLGTQTRRIRRVQPGEDVVDQLKPLSEADVVDEPAAAQ